MTYFVVPFGSEGFAVHSNVDGDTIQLPTDAERFDEWSEVERRLRELLPDQARDGMSNRPE